jgi:Uncharacterized phage-associated protein
MALYSALLISSYIIDYYDRTGRLVSNLKLQKLLYFVQAEFLVATGHPCFSEVIEAWDFGPVVPAAFYEYSIYGAAFIPHKKMMGVASNHIESRHRKSIDNILETLSSYSSPHLVKITTEQSPWKQAYHPRRKCEIPHQAIKDFFRE